MAAPDGDAGQLSAGRLSYGSSNLTGSFPYAGGTILGLVGAVFVFPQRLWKGLDAEETNAPSEVQWLGGPVVVSFTLMGWDEDATAVIFPNSATSNSKTVVEWPGSDVTAGAPVATITNVVFTPNDLTNGKGFVIYKAAVIPDLNAELAFTAGRFLEIPAVLIALPDGTERLGKLGKFSELTL